MAEIQALQAFHLGVVMSDLARALAEEAERAETTRRVGPGAVRKFSTGATRDVEDEKLDPEAFLDPLALGEYFEFMHRHRKQKDGSLRDGDNWQKGFTRKSIMKSLWRHSFDVWLMHRGHEPKSQDARHLFILYGKDRAMIESLCGVLFNAFAYMREILLKRSVEA